MFKKSRQITSISQCNQKWRKDEIIVKLWRKFMLNYRKAIKYYLIKGKNKTGNVFNELKEKLLFSEQEYVYKEKLIFN